MGTLILSLVSYGTHVPTAKFLYTGQFEFLNLFCVLVICALISDITCCGSFHHISLFSSPLLCSVSDINVIFFLFKRFQISFFPVSLSQVSIILLSCRCIVPLLGCDKVISCFSIHTFPC